MSEPRRRVGILFDNLGPYHAARLAGAALYSDIIAIEASPTRSEYEWARPELSDDIDYFPLEGSIASKNDRALRRASFDRLFARRLDALALPGWSSHATLAMLKEAWRRGIPTILMSETNEWDFARRNAAERIKRGVVAHFAAGFVTSDSQRDYLVQLGMAADAIFRGYNAVDNDFFATEAEARMAGPMPEIAGVPMPERARGRYFLTSNRFIEKKNLLRLLRCYAAFRQNREDDPADWPLVLLGDGEQRGEIEALRSALALEAHVLMPGFRQIDELPSFYATAGAFIHASTIEQWGLVVNEAMASGLLVGVSRRCGCAEVLVTHGENGFVFDPFDDAQILAALRGLADADTATRARMTDASRARVADWGPARFGRGMAEAAAYAIAKGPARPGLIFRIALSIATRQRVIESARLQRSMFSRPI